MIFPLLSLRMAISSLRVILSLYCTGFSGDRSTLSVLCLWGQAELPISSGRESFEGADRGGREEF